MRFTQRIVQVGMRLCKKHFSKIYNIEANTENLHFLIVVASLFDK